jgi:hypothetical protein
MYNGPEKPIVALPNPPGRKAKERRAERRATLRYPFTATAEVAELRSQARLAGRSSDLGLGGCYIDTISPFAVGTPVRVRIVREPHKFEAMARITYAHASMGMGMAFTEIKPEHLSVLKTWIAELSGEQLPEGDQDTATPEDDLLATNANLRSILNELINLMIRKKLIDESEGAGLLRQMFQ